MQRWRVIVEGNWQGKQFMRTAIVGAEDAVEAGKVACAESELDGDQFTKYVEVAPENSEAKRAGLLSISGRVFFDH